MSPAQGALIGAAVAIQLACALGALTLRDPFDRLHLVGPVSVLATLPLVAAVVLGASSTSHVAKVVVTGLFLWVSSPFATRATARALRVRATGRLALGDDDAVEGRAG